MRKNCLALALFVFLAISQCQESDSIKSPLSIGLSLAEEITCNEPVQFGSEMLEAAKLATFKIDIKNNGKEPLRNLEIFAIMPIGFKYLGSSYGPSDLREADIAESLEPYEFNEKQKTKIGWNISSLQEKENRSILVKMIFKCQIDKAQIKLLAYGDSPDHIVLNTTIWDESLGECECQESDSIKSPLSIGLSLAEEIACNEPVQFGSEMLEAARLATFKIDIKNNGKEPLRNLEIFAIMPIGFKYLGSSYGPSDLREADIAESLEPYEFNEKQKTKIGWNISSMQENENRSIYVRIIFKCQIDRAQIKLLAQGDTPDHIVLGTDIWDESLGECECLKHNDKDKEKGSPLKVDISLLNETMGDWIQFSPAKTELSRLGIYEINVKNAGEKSIDNLVVFIVLPKGMKYMNSRYSETVGDKLDVIVEPLEFNEALSTNITWNVGTLQENEFKSILVNSYLRCPVSKTYIKLAAIGEVAGRSAIASKNESIELTDYDCYKENIDISLQVWEANSNTSADFGKDNPKPAKLEIYNISVTNGEIPLQKVKVIAELPRGMMFINSSYYDSGIEKLDVKLAPNQNHYDENRTTNLVCNIDNLSPWETKTIILAVYLKEDIKERDISAMVQGYSPYLPENEPIIVFADPAINACSDRSEGGAEISEAIAAIPELQDLIHTVCLSWTENIDIPMLLQSHESINK